METAVNEEVDDGAVEIAEEDVKKAEESFEAGLTKVRDSIKQESPSFEEPPVEEEEEVEPVKIAGFSEEELQAAVKKANQYDNLKSEFEATVQKLTGKFGDLNRKIMANQGGKPRTISVEDLAGINEEFGPEFAEVMAKDLSKLVLDNNGQSIDQESINELVKSRMGEELEKAKLEMWHPDWLETVASQEMNTWLSTTKTPAEVEHFRTTNAAKDVSKFLKEYEKHVEATKAQKESADQAAQTAADLAEKKKKRLDAAITPRGTPQPGKKPLDGNAAFNAGLKRAKAHRLNQ